MPTGYTAICGEKPEITFQEFAWRCARAMGACFTQRDDSSSAPVNMDEQPTDYHLNRMAETEAEGRRLQKADASAEHNKALEEARGRITEMYAKNVALKATYQRLLGEVVKWNPPSPDHIGLQKFMEQQLTESIGFDCGSGSYYREDLGKLMAQTPEEFLKVRIREVAKEWAYHSEQHLDEIDRVAGRNRWKAELAASIGAPSQG
jgi:hypothetical protein